MYDMELIDDCFEESDRLIEAGADPGFSIKG